MVQNERHTIRPTEAIGQSPDRSKDIDRGTVAETGAQKRDRDSGRNCSRGKDINRGRCRNRGGGRKRQS